MEISLLDEHQELASAIYRQRKELLKKPWADSRLLGSIEHRLRAHLFVLSHYIDEDEEQPDSEHDVFIYLVRRILAFNEKTKKESWNNAIAWLGETGAKADGAEVALILFPPYGEHKQLLEEAHRNIDESRSKIIDIWNKVDYKMSTESVKSSNLINLPDKVQIATLEYAARSQDYSEKYFQNYYMPLVNGKGDINQHLLEPAIFAGLVRSDPNAKSALLRGIERYPNTPVQLRLLRLAALSGDSELLSVLDGFKRSSPVIGYYLLALHGNKQSVSIMIEGLKQASELEHAEKGWNLLTNYTLPRIRRMYLAADSNSSLSKEEFDDDYDDEIFELDEEFDDEENETETVPDVDAAIAWWTQNKDSWQEQSRYFQGEVVNTNSLAKMAIQSSGKITKDFIDALTLRLETPIRDCSEIWFEQRKKLLETYSDGEGNTDSSIPGHSNSGVPENLKRQTSKPLGRPYARAR